VQWRPNQVDVPTRALHELRWPRRMTPPSPVWRHPCGIAGNRRCGARVGDGHAAIMGYLARAEVGRVEAGLEHVALFPIPRVLRRRCTSPARRVYDAVGRRVSRSGRRAASRRDALQLVDAAELEGVTGTDDELWLQRDARCVVPRVWARSALMALVGDTGFLSRLGSGLDRRGW
jgi:hypothetical protein